MAEHNQTGIKGEMIAANYLREKGYQIIECNKKFGRAEIDIIAKIGNEYVFVEVKTRKTAYFGFPEEAINDKKIGLMTLAAELFCEEIALNTEVRFDLISLILQTGKPEIIHIEDAFFFGSEEF